MKIQSFDGSLNTRLRPQFLQANQSVVSVNTNLDIGSLGPIASPRDTDIEVKRYQQWYDAEQRWVDSDISRDYVEFQGSLYWTDRVSVPRKLRGTKETNLGIVPPAKVTATANSAAPSPRGFTAKTETGSGNLPAMDLYYLLVGTGTKAAYGRVDARGNYTILSQEITVPPAPGSVKDSISDQLHKTTFSDFTSTTKVYRYYKDNWRLVGTGGVVVDSTLDISANAALPEDSLPEFFGVFTYVMTYYNSSDGTESGPSPVSIEASIKNGGSVTLSSLSASSDPQVDKKRIYRVGGNLTQFTLIVELANSVTSFVDTVKDSDSLGSLLNQPSAAQAPVGLSFLTEAYAMLFGAVGVNLRFTPIGRPEEWPESYSIQYESNITGIAPVANGILVFTKYKTHVVTGTGPTALSTHLLSGDQGCLAHESIQQFGTEALWVSTDGVCASAGGIPRVVTKDLLGKVRIDAIDSAVYDEVYYVLEEDKLWALDKGRVQQFDFGIKTLNVADDELYGYKDGKLVELFRGSDLAYFKYKSPRFVEGTVTDNKTYKKVCIFSSGHIIIKILIDDEVVQTATLDTKDNHTIQVPQRLQRGFYIQFEVEGTGEVFEIEYEIGQQR